MRHTNPNMITAVLDGIELAENIARHERAEAVFQRQLEILEEMRDALAVTRTGRYLIARCIAFAEGYVAAYLAAQR